MLELLVLCKWTKEKNKLDLGLTPHVGQINQVTPSNGLHMRQGGVRRETASVRSEEYN